MCQVHCASRMFTALSSCCQATVFKCNPDCSISPLQAYSDADVRSVPPLTPNVASLHFSSPLFQQPEETFYTCAWTYDIETGESLLAIAGAKGLIRIVG